MKNTKLIKNIREPIKNPRVVYQGEPGAYSEMAARDYFGEDVLTKGLYQFEDVFLSLEKGEADYALLPIENSSTGAIRQVYGLLEKYPFFFVGETSVPIHHALMALPGTKIEDIHTIYSHEQGLFQCESYLKQHPNWKAIPQADTAGSAKLVAHLQDPHAAAICSELAAKIYGLHILEKKVNSNSTNTTRFVVVSTQLELGKIRNKTIVSFIGQDNLNLALQIFVEYQTTLIRIESRPIPEHKWEYMFFIEMAGDIEDPVLEQLSKQIENLRILGSFCSNLKP